MLFQKRGIDYTDFNVQESVGIAKALAAKNGYDLDSNQEVCFVDLSPTFLAIKISGLLRMSNYVICVEALGLKMVNRAWTRSSISYNF